MWYEKYVGKRYTNEYDCSDFVHDVMLNERGIDIPLPSDRLWRRKTARSIVCYAADMVKRVSEYIDYDVVVMRLLGQKRILGSHVGLIVIQSIGTVSVIHNMRQIGVIITPIYRLPGMNLEVEGIYRWINH